MQKYKLKDVPMLIFAELVLYGVLGNIVLEIVVSTFMVFCFHSLYKENNKSFKLARNAEIVNILLLMGAFVGAVYIQDSQALVYLSISSALLGTAPLLVRYFYIKGFIEIAKKNQLHESENKIKLLLKPYVILQAVVVASSSMAYYVLNQGIIGKVVEIIVLALPIVVVIVLIIILFSIYSLHKEVNLKIN